MTVPSPAGAHRGGLRAVQLGTGIAFLIGPGRCLRAVGAESGSTSRAAVRLLGARHLAQAALEYRGGRSALRWGATVDLAHAGSALAFAHFDRHKRRAWQGSAGLALALALGQIVVSCREPGGETSRVMVGPVSG